MTLHIQTRNPRLLVRNPMILLENHVKPKCDVVKIVSFIMMSLPIVCVRSNGCSHSHCSVANLGLNRCSSIPAPVPLFFFTLPSDGSFARGAEPFHVTLPSDGRFARKVRIPIRFVRKGFPSWHAYNVYPGVPRRSFAEVRHWRNCRRWWCLETACCVNDVFVGRAFCQKFVGWCFGKLVPCICRWNSLRQHSCI